MSTLVSRTIVATLERINTDFGGNHHNSSMGTPGIMSAPYQVDLDLITTKLGRFLVENTGTTQRDDDASTVLLLSPSTVGDTTLSWIATQHGMQKPSGMLASVGRTSATIAKIRADLD